MSDREKLAHSLCTQPREIPVVLPPDLAPLRERAIRLFGKKWVSGTILHYHFLEHPGWTWSANQKDAVRKAFDRWKSLGIGLFFMETADVSEAEIRIGFDQSDGSWSYVGTDILEYEDHGRTMNFGWDLTDDWGGATALHEIGHALGLEHEHQSPNAGLVWDEEAVYAAFSRPPNSWSRDQIFHNIINKLAVSGTQGSAWDARSIMEYPFDPGLIRSPHPYDVKGIPPNYGLSPDDVVWVKRFYPPSSAPSPIAAMQMVRLDAGPGDQADFVFEPQATRNYAIQLLGESDCKVILFEERDGGPRHLAGQDDSGSDSNARIEIKLVKGRRYLIRVRVHYINSPDGAGLVII